MSDLMWWGYRHSCREPVLKRWFGDVRDYTTDCEDNPFVLKVIEPFAANTWEKAWEILREKLNENKR